MPWSPSAAGDGYAAGKALTSSDGVDWTERARGPDVHFKTFIQP